MSQNCGSSCNTFSQCPQENASSQPRLLPLFPVEVPPSTNEHSRSSSGPNTFSQFPQEAIPSQLRLLPQNMPLRTSHLPRIPREPFCGSLCVIGKSQHMEDAISIVPHLYMSTIPFAACFLHFYGVFDGHMGSLVSGFCRSQMHQMVLKVLRAPPREINGVPYMSVQWWDIIMTRSFKNMDDLVLITCPCGEFGVDCGKHSTHTRPNYFEFVGSSAAVVLLSNNQIVIANCGDSGVILSNNGNTIPLTTAHKPDRPDEHARIQAFGGRITRSAEGRAIVENSLATTRAIGNRYLKRYLIPDPDVALRTRDAKDEFLIIASDGFWNAVSPSMACHVAWACFRDSDPPFYANENDPYGVPHSFGTSIPSTSSMYSSPSATAATTLTRLAGARGSEDNISVIVVDLMNNRH